MTWIQKNLSPTLQPQAKCSLGTHHRGQTLTRMEFFSAFYHTWASVTSHGWRFIVYSLFHYPTKELQRRPRLVGAGSHYLQSSLWTKWPECRKNPSWASPVVTWTPSNVQFGHMLQEPHTSQDGIFLWILPIIVAKLLSFICMVFR